MEKLFSMGLLELKIREYNRLHGTDHSMDVVHALIGSEYPDEVDDTLSEWEDQFAGRYPEELAEMFKPIAELMDKDNKTDDDIKNLEELRAKFVDDVNAMFAEYANGKSLNITQYSKDLHTNPGEDYGTAGPNMVPPADWQPGDPKPEEGGEA